MEQYVDMNSPFTGGRVKEVFTTEVQEFRKENYTVHARYYVCEDTGEKFTTTEQDELKFNELYGQYRVRHGIPFPEEIKATREKYGLSLAAISKILGFGINQYANYENGWLAFWTLHVNSFLKLSTRKSEIPFFQHQKKVHLTNLMPFSTLTPHVLCITASAR